VEARFVDQNLDYGFSRISLFIAMHYYPFLLVFSSSMRIRSSSSIFSVLLAHAFVFPYPLARAYATLLFISRASPIPYFD